MQRIRTFSCVMIAHVVFQTIVLRQNSLYGTSTYEVDDRIVGKVLESDRGIVQASIGSRQGLEKGEILYVYRRQGNSSNQLVCSFQPYSVLLDQCSGYAEPGKVQAGDIVVYSKNSQPRKPVEPTPVSLLLNDTAEIFLSSSAPGGKDLVFGRIVAFDRVNDTEVRRIRVRLSTKQEKPTTYEAKEVARIQVKGAVFVFDHLSFTLVEKAAYERRQAERATVVESRKQREREIDEAFRIKSHVVNPESGEFEERELSFLDLKNLKATQVRMYQQATGRKKDGKIEFLWDRWSVRKKLQFVAYVNERTYEEYQRRIAAAEASGRFQRKAMTFLVAGLATYQTMRGISDSIDRGEVPDLQAVTESFAGIAAGVTVMTEEPGKPTQLPLGKGKRTAGQELTEGDFWSLALQLCPRRTPSSSYGHFIAFRAVTWLELVLNATDTSATDSEFMSVAGYVMAKDLSTDGMCDSLPFYDFWSKQDAVAIREACGKYVEAYREASSAEFKKLLEDARAAGKSTTEATLGALDDKGLMRWSCVPASETIGEIARAKREGCTDRSSELLKLSLPKEHEIQVGDHVRNPFLPVPLLFWAGIVRSIDKDGKAQVEITYSASNSTPAGSLQEFEKGRYVWKGIFTSFDEIRARFRRR